MTLGEGKRKVLKLLDEYSSGGTVNVDEDVNAKMNDFFDIAQKDVAQHKRIVRSMTMDASDVSEMQFVDLPKDCAAVFRTWRDGKLSWNFAVIGGKLALPAKTQGSYIVEYFAIPASITEATADEYEFEVSEDAANCLPYFVAAQHLLPDLVIDYSSFYNIYLAMRAALDTSLPGAGKGSVRQVLFGG